MNRPIVLLTLLLIPTLSAADERLQGIACRSVHVGYSGQAGTAFYVEGTVRQTADGTYFCAAGFNSGYFGIQQLGNGKKLAIFSVWDPAGGDDPRKIPEAKRVKLLHKGEGVRVGRFGGEGTGGQSFYDFDWKVGDTYRFLVTAEPVTGEEGRTAFAGYLYLPAKKEWLHMVTFSTVTPNTKLGGYYSFVEDFKRDRKSTEQVRTAEFGNAWVRTEKGEWIAVTEARFTADSNPVTNIDAGVTKAGDRWFLSTGGATENTTTKLREKMPLPKDAKPMLPKDLPVK